MSFITITFIYDNFIIIHIIIDLDRTMVVLLIGCQTQSMTHIYELPFAITITKMIVTIIIILKKIKNNGTYYKNNNNNAKINNNNNNNNDNNNNDKKNKRTRDGLLE